MVNWLVQCKSLCHSFADHVHMVLESHWNTTSIMSRHRMMFTICIYIFVSDLEFRNKMGMETPDPLMKQFAQVQYNPHKSYMFSRGDSVCRLQSLRYSLAGSLFCSNYHHCSRLTCPALEVIGSIYPGSSKVVTGIGAPSSPLYSPMDQVNVWLVSSLAKRLLNVDAPCTSMSALGLFSPLWHGFQMDL